jgi:DNA-binding protein H-NS
MSSYTDLLAQKRELERLLGEAREKEVEDAIARIRDDIAIYQLSPLDLGFTRKELLAAAASKPRQAKGSKGSVLPPKYRDPASGKTWSGRGRMPGWMTPETAGSFAV